jgi:hypothetical protein
VQSIFGIRDWRAPSHERVPAVGNDHDIRPLDDGAAALLAASHADHTPILDHDLVHRGAFANLRSGFGGGIDQQLVEDGALRTVRKWSF